MLLQTKIVSSSKWQLTQSLRILSLIGILVLLADVAHSQSQPKISALKNNLKDSDVSVRLSAIAELAELGPDARDAIPELIEALKDRNEEVRMSAMEALAGIGKDAVPALIEATKNESVDIRWGAAEAIRKIGPEAKAAVPELKRLLEDKDKLIRLRAAYTLAIFGPDGRAAVSILIEALNDENSEERLRAVEALSRIGVPAVDPLTQAMDREEAVVRQGAADALKRIGIDAKDSIPSLLKALKDREPSVRRYAAAALGNFWRDAGMVAPPLIEALNDSDPTVVKAACHSLGRLGQVSRAAIPQLTRLSKSNSTLVRRSAATSLGDIADTLYRFGTKSDIEALNTAHQVLSSSQDPEVQKHAERVKRTLDYLSLISRMDIVEWLLSHRYITSIVVLYALLLIACLLMFWARPDLLLSVNEKLADKIDIQLPPWLSGNKVPLRYALLVGFFHHHERVLDAWIRKHVASARKQFFKLPTVTERNVHVSSPVLLEGNMIPSLSPQHLHSTFGPEPTYLLILGEGGSGKTSYACQLAKWAMADENRERLCPQHHMLPILIEQDVGPPNESTNALLVIIRNHLRALIGANAPPSDKLIKKLLNKKRLLIIVDSLSEMSDSSRNNVLTGINDLLLNACIITSRTDAKLDRRTLMEPQRIRGNQLATFMEAYLVRLGKRIHFTDDEFFEHCKHLGRMVGEREITSLLAKSYADQMVAAKERGDTNLPKDIPDLMVKYVSAIARQSVAENDIERVISTAKNIAWRCLKTSFRPSDTSRSQVLEMLGEKGSLLWTYLKDKLRLIQLSGSAGENVRFSLDPLAEYLAGLYLVEQYRNDEDKWRQFLAEADRKEGAPEAIKGFLLAVRDCCLAKQKDVPAFVADELAKRTGVVPVDPAVVYEARRTARLLADMKSDLAEERVQATRELIWINSAPAAAAVIDALSDPDSRVQTEALHAFAFPKPHLTVPLSTLIAKLKHESREVREAASFAFVNIVPLDTTAVSALMETLRDDDELVRANAANAIGAIARAILPPETVPQSDYISLFELLKLSEKILSELQKRGNGSNSQPTPSVDLQPTDSR